MSERGLHFIADDLSDTWIEDWAGAGVAEIEDLLGKHADFLSVLGETDETELAPAFLRPKRAEGR
jgi:hypothetical protein